MTQRPVITETPAKADVLVGWPMREFSIPLSEDRLTYPQEFVNQAALS